MKIKVENCYSCILVKDTCPTSCGHPVGPGNKVCDYDVYTGIHPDCPLLREELRVFLEDNAKSVPWNHEE
jgi:hypothetical protein